jgi:L-ascorbate metabolism protein UlaG (beta-lactamase superfamily)
VQSERVQLTHFGHACVLLDTGTARLLIDPGAFSTGFESLTGLDAILITHQHFDHLEPERLPGLLRANPDVRLIVDPGTAGQLDAIDHETVAPGDSVEIAGARVDVIGDGEHEVIHPDIPMITNNGYLIGDVGREGAGGAGTLLHPGDAYVPVPDGSDPVETLLLPTGAPWLKVSDAVDYLRAMTPRTAVPIHEAVLADAGRQLHYGLFTNLAPKGTTVKVVEREEATTV